MASLTESRLRQIIKEEARRVLREGSDVSFLVSEFMRDHDDDIERVRDEFGRDGRDPVKNLEFVIKNMSDDYGYRASPNDITDAAIRIARMMGAERRRISRRYHEEEIEDPYGPEDRY